MRALALALTALLAPATAAADLLPHRAFYRLGLAATAPGPEAVERVEGAMALRWGFGCDGFETRQRLAFEGVRPGGRPFAFAIDYRATESFDGRTLRFAVETSGEGGTETFRGTARLAKEGGVARFAAPDSRRVALPLGAVFPTEHLRRLVAAAEAGEDALTLDVFDGSGFDAATSISAVIGRPRPPREGDGPEALRPDATRYPVALAYHRAADGERPGFEARLLIDGGGVVHRLRLDYGDFVLSGDLDRFEPLDPPAC